jgi:glycosyltransferase involved in cell wall biosynthesis
MNDQLTDRHGGDGPQTRILALIWHAPHYVISAGGFKRTYEIFKRVPPDTSIVAIDNSPSFLADIESDRLRVVEYRVPQVVRRFEQEHFIVERMAEWLLSFLLITAECVKLKLRGERFDVIFVPSSEQLPALLGGIVARFLFRRKLVACNMNIEWFSERARPLVIRAHNQADLLITLSRDLRKTLRHSGTGVPVVINGAGLDMQCIKRALAGVPVQKRYDAVFVGRHDLEKGIMDLVEIWSLVTEQRPGAQLVMVGSCNPVNNAILTAQIARFGMEDNITLAGVVDEDEKFLIMKSSRLCLFPSYMEGWGIVPQEALACGLPVLVYDLPVYRENIRDCEAVFAVPVGDVRAMADRAVALLAEDRFEQYERSGLSCVSQFCWDAVARREFAILAGEE